MEDGKVVIGFRNTEHRDNALIKIKDDYNDIEIAAVEIGTTPSLAVNLTYSLILETKQTALQQNIITLRNRIN